MGGLPVFHRGHHHAVGGPVAGELVGHQYPRHIPQSLIVAAFPNFEWDVVGGGRIWPFPEQAACHHQTWLREPATGQYRVDVFREPHVGDRWVCRRDESITLPYDELILHTRDAIPCAIPEVALLFKAKALRDKDEADFQRVLPLMDRSRRSRLSEWLCRVHPGHPWLERISIHRC